MPESRIRPGQLWQTSTGWIVMTLYEDRQRLFSWRCCMVRCVRRPLPPIDQGVEGTVKTLYPTEHWRLVSDA